MSKVVITRSKLDGLATTIAAKSGATLPLTIAQMDAAVQGIEKGIVPSGTKSITENGTGIDVAQYASVDVAVPSPTPSLQSKTTTPTTSQQVITADSGYDGLSQITVEPIPSNYGLITWDGSVLTVS